MVAHDSLSLARENVDAFNAGDFERFRAILAPNTVYQEFATQRRVEGADQVTQATQGWKQAFPDARGTVTNALGNGNTAVLEITWEGTQTGPLESPNGVIPPSGKRVRVAAAQVITIADGKIKETRHYFDLLGMLQQLGVAAS